MSRRAREGIEQGGFYPEPAWITARGGMRFWYRFLLGRPMDGQRWSDSTFWRSATRGEDQWWLRLAGWQRSLARCAALYVLTLLAPLFILIHYAAGLGSALLLLAAHAAAALTLAAPVLIYRGVRAHGLALPWIERRIGEDAERHVALTKRVLIHGRRAWEREKVRPVARTVAAKLGRRYHPREAAQWVHVPRDYREQGGGAVEILLPQSFMLNDTARRSLAKAAAERLGVRDPVASYELEGNAPRLLLSAPVLPPDFVSFADMLPHLRSAQEYTFVLGMSGSEALSISLKEDSPHIGVSAGSGGGKSELIKTVSAQGMHWGWSTLILDWKGESQEWAEGLPGVRYVRSIEALHDTLVEIGEEIEWRRMLRSREERDALPRILVVGEEWSITAPLLTEYWSALRSSAEPEERRTMPLRSPAVVAAMKLVFTGRSLGFTLLLVAIRFSARVTNGNADMRESFTTILMTRWKAQTARMLAPDIRPFPKKLTKPGQWLAVTGEEAVRLQGGLWSDEEAREWATNGTPPPASPWSERYGGVSEVRGSHSSELGKQLPGRLTAGSHATSGDDVIEGEEVPAAPLLKLRDLVDSVDHLGFSLKDLQRAASGGNEKDERFPAVRGGTQFKGYLFDRNEVVHWARSKRASEVAKKEAGR